MERYSCENLYDRITSSQNVETESRRRHLQERFNVPSAIEYLTPIHRVVLRPPKRRRGFTVTGTKDLPKSAETSNDAPAKATHHRTILKLKPRSERKHGRRRQPPEHVESEIERPRQPNTDSKSANGKVDPKDDRSHSAHEIDKESISSKRRPRRQDRVREREIEQPREQQTNRKHSTSKVDSKPEDDDSDCVQEALPLDELDKEHRFSKRRPQRQDRILEREPPEQQADRNNLTSNVGSKPEDEDSDSIYKTLGEDDFDVVKISGAQQNCLYRCVVLGCDRKMLQNYLGKSDGIIQKLDAAAQTLRRQVCEFGRRELSTFTELTFTYGYEEILKERNCSSLADVIDQIGSRRVAADSFDKLLLVNYLRVKLVVFRFDKSTNRFHFLATFEPEKVYLRAKDKSHVPVVFVKHLYSPVKKDEVGEHFELLIPNN